MTTVALRILLAVVDWSPSTDLAICEMRLPESCWPVTLQNK